MICCTESLSCKEKNTRGVFRKHTRAVTFVSCAVKILKNKKSAEQVPEFGKKL